MHKETKQARYKHKAHLQVERALREGSSGVQLVARCSWKNSQKIPRHSIALHPR